MGSSVAVKERFFEDYTQGERFEFGGLKVSESEVIEFAERFDPQYFHTDPEKAKESIYGGVIASGWHSAAMAMRLIVDNFTTTAGMGSPGVDELRWLKPVRPNDVLSLRLTVTDTRASRSKQDRGIVKYRAEMSNHHGEIAMSFIATFFVKRRHSA